MRERGLVPDPGARKSPRSNWPGRFARPSRRTRGYKIAAGQAIGMAGGVRRFTTCFLRSFHDAAINPSPGRHHRRVALVHDHRHQGRVSRAVRWERDGR